MSAGVRRREAETWEAGSQCVSRLQDVAAGGRREESEASIVGIGHNTTTG